MYLSNTNSNTEAAECLNALIDDIKEARIMEAKYGSDIRGTENRRILYECRLDGSCTQAQRFLFYKGLSIETLRELMDALEHPFSAAPKPRTPELSDDALPTFVPIPTIRRLR